MFVSPPDVAPHPTGAAVDVVLLWAGFVNYPTEWWHWSYGDRYWVMATGASHTFYGPAELPPSTGESALEQSNE